MSNYIATDGFFGDVWSGIKKVTGGAADVYGEGKKAEGAAAAAKAAAKKQTGMPGWIMPVAIGGGVLALVLSLRKR